MSEEQVISLISFNISIISGVSIMLLFISKKYANLYKGIDNSNIMGWHIALIVPIMNIFIVGISILFLIFGLILYICTKSVERLSTFIKKDDF